MNKSHLRYVKNNARQVMVVGNSLKIFAQAKIRGTMSTTVHLEEMVEDIHSCNIKLEKGTLANNSKPELKIKSRKKGVKNFHLLEDKIEYFLLFFVAKSPR